MRRGRFLRSCGKYEVRQLGRPCDDQRLYIVYNLRNDKMVYANVQESEVDKWVSKRTSKLC